MKKIFTLMAAALFAASASAQTETVILSWNEEPTLSSVTTEEMSNSGTSDNLATWENGYSIMIMRSDKAQSSGNSLTIDDVAYKTIKVSNGAQNKLILPEGKVTKKITLYSYVNWNLADKGTLEHRDSYWSEVAGVKYTFEDSPMTSYMEDKSTVSGMDKYEYTFEKALNEVTFTNAGEQCCYVLFVEVEDGTPEVGGDDQGNTGDDEPIEGAYIAWVYSEGYGVYSYAFETDPVVIALKEKYNVVAVSIDDNTNPTADEELNGKLLGADVVVVCEAMTGNKTMSNSLVNYVGQVPVVALKAYNYNDGRWNWGTPANPNPKALGFTPKSNAYNVLEGVTYEEDGTVKVATSDATNVIQTVSFGAGAPEDMVIMGTVGGEDTAAAMYASKAQKFFGLGLSSDCWSSYTANAGIIVKNAVTMLIAGEDLTAVGDETGIQNVVKTVSNGAIYNLAGQKVDENYKGVVIKNGKKVVLK